MPQPVFFAAVAHRAFHRRPALDAQPGLGKSASWNRAGIHGYQLFYQPVAGRGHQPQLVPIVKKRSGQHARFLKKIAVESQRRDHVSCVMRYFRKGLALAAQRGQRLHHRFHPLALRPAQPSRLLRMLHRPIPFHSAFSL